MSQRTIQRGDVGRLEVQLAGINVVAHVVEVDHAGVTFRRKGHRHSVAAPWRLVLGLAERLAGEQLHQEQLRQAALRRADRARRIRA